MTDLTLIIPSRNEMFLKKTVEDVLQKSETDLQLIAVCDDSHTDPDLPGDKRLTVVRFGGVRGMRGAINAGAALAKGKYLMKADGHCMFEQGFDKKLMETVEDNWIVIPRRYRLDAENWAWKDVGKPPIDYHYLSCPMTNPDGYSMHGAIWPERDKLYADDPNRQIDETMSFQGSCWFMSKKHWDWLGGMSEIGYGGFCQEPQEIGNKTWLGGGKIMVNKKVWYAHLHKGKQYGRGYFQSKEEIVVGHTWAGHHWMRNEEPNMIHKMEWLIDRFWPVPTWPDNWRELVQ